MPRCREWTDAWFDALYGPGGFFARGERPAGHFRTAPLVGPELAEALLELLRRVDTALGHPATLDFVDVGAGGGELAGTVRALATGELGRRLRVSAVDLAPPPDTAPGVRWLAEPPERVAGLLVGHEWLDAVPCPVVTRCGPRWHRVLVNPSGAEAVGDPVDSGAATWLRRWWPRTAEGERAEAGITRDAAWAGAVAAVRAGAALAVDYGHLLADRAAGRYPAGTLTGYRHGRQLPPVPDGSRDLTAHVALDACAAAAEATGTVTGTVLVAQRDALAALGLTADTPAAGLAGADPMAWLDASWRAGRVAELRAPGGLGAFGWLLQTTGGVPVADLLPPLPPWRP
ncbi:SAM-dependent methyltransferase [Gandjariella thermophila]|uniref:SAM-dependent methyltransferase n=1 Tax=Gandjariella thermophila TaxID=1931992 RepID=UPI0010F50274|nr:SAM-dependent methyltransferase [Gandjariella thermophila]